YTVIDGDISDVEFTKLLESIFLEDYENMVEPTKTLIQSATPENFIEKIRFREKTFDSASSVALVKVFSQLGDCFPDTGNAFFSWFTPHSQAAIFIAQLIRNQVTDELKYDSIGWVVGNAVPFEFSYQ